MALLPKSPRRQSPNCPLLPRAILLLPILLLPIPLLHLYYFSHHHHHHQPSPRTSLPTTNTSTTTTTMIARPPPTPDVEPHCDYFVGKWIPSSLPPLYNDTSCSTIKDGQNCMAHGRPDTSYLRYRWVPSSCAPLPGFHPATFLSLLRHRHLAFVGDSMARNQLESLLCLLSSHSSPRSTLVSSDRKNRRWLFPSHNLTVSLFWSPFLVRGLEKSPPSLHHNVLHLDSADLLWSSSSSSADVLVLSAGHWFLHPALYLDSAGAGAGCHALDGVNNNCTEVGFYGAFGRAFRTALAAVFNARRAVGSTSPAMVVVTTFTPAHFEGEWDRLGSCARTEPYGEREAGVVGWMDAEMRRRQVAEVEAAKGEAAGIGVTLEPLDVTRMAAMRPDGHPGPYMQAFPFREGVRERVPNDCVHWCLPGPIDAWNEILLHMVKRWRKGIRRKQQGLS